MRLRDTCRSIPANEILEGMRLYGSEITSVENIIMEGSEEPIRIDIRTKNGEHYSIGPSEYVWVKVGE